MLRSKLGGSIMFTIVSLFTMQFTSLHYNKVKLVFQKWNSNKRESGKELKFCFKNLSLNKKLEKGKKLFKQRCQF